MFVRAVEQCLDRGFIEMAEIGDCLEGLLSENQGTGMIKRKSSKTTLPLIDRTESITRIPTVRGISCSKDC